VLYGVQRFNLMKFRVTDRCEITTLSLTAAKLLPSPIENSFFLTGLGTVMTIILGLIFVVAAVLLNVAGIRKKILTGPLLKYVRAVLPPMSQTERDAIEAGTVWWESELFRGNPDWSKLMSTPQATLSAKEQAFLDGPTNELCAMIDDWEVTYEYNDLPPHIWDFVKKNKFFGIVIPENFST